MYAPTLGLPPFLRTTTGRTITTMIAATIALTTTFTILLTPGPVPGATGGAGVGVSVVPEPVRGGRVTDAGDRLTIERIGVDAPVDDAELLTGAEYGQGGQMDVPTDVSRLGWLETSARGSDLIGAAIVSGHVSDTSDSPGAMWRLDEVVVGDVVTWTHHGVETRYEVNAIDVYPRSGELPAAMFDMSSAKTLYVVTCTNRKDLGGGKFTYPDNLVVTATPIV